MVDPAPRWTTVGAPDLRRAVDRLAARVPTPLAPLARAAYDFGWAWADDGPATFRALDPGRFESLRRNPVRLLAEAGPETLERAAADEGFVARATALADALAAARARPWGDGVDPAHPVAFFCAEFGVHPSLPIYSGGLGVLAGDVLKEASDRALPMVGVGLLYRRGYFHQRLDVTGWQHEYWTETDPDLLPAARVRATDGSPLVVRVPVWDREVAVHVWRVDVGRVPLLLLDTDVEENTPLDRWIAARLYDGNRAIRLAQYTVLGVGGVRALAALDVEPSVVHLNEGHAGLAALELASAGVAAGASFADAVAEVRRRVVFTTHTPVAAGNETYGGDEILDVLGAFPARLGLDRERFLGLGRIRPDDASEPSGMTAISIRTSRHVNGVSRRHGEVAARMWRPLFEVGGVEPVPIGAVTNGVHLPTWMAAPIRRVLDRHLGAGWRERASDPEVWAAIDDVPDAELWEARRESRAALITLMRHRSVTDRLTRGEPIEYVEAAARALDPDALTIGFARRLAAYKRLHLLGRDPARATALLQGDRPVQLLFGGKAHPQDDAGKTILHDLFGLKSSAVGERVAFLEDYDLFLAPMVVAGCDLWVNLPRPPLEASGTSGMKVALNGGLNLSVLDGWWAEAYDGTNGWAIEGAVDDDTDGQDDRHAAALYDTLEREVVPLFHERGTDGVPHAWVRMVKASLRTIGPRFCATRMLDDYVRDVYPTPPPPRR